MNDEWRNGKSLREGWEKSRYYRASKRAKKSISDSWVDAKKKAFSKRQLQIFPRSISTPGFGTFDLKSQNKRNEKKNRR